MDLSGGPTMWDAKLEVTLHVEEAGWGSQGGLCVKIWRDPVIITVSWNLSDICMRPTLLRALLIATGL